MTDEQLAVYLHGQPAGRLSQDQSGTLRFEYESTYLATPGNIPLSLSLPVRAGAFDDQPARFFFSNLLPEGEPRRALARNLGLSAANEFALLREVGGDCAGAVQILPWGEPIGRGGAYRPISRAQLRRRLLELPTRPLLAGEGGLRLSLAGAQDKLPIYFDGAEFALPEAGAPSSHILKPAIARLADAVGNEAFCMRLAAAAGLKVPAVAVVDIEGPVYLIERYDRHAAEPGAPPRRIHQEDFCQALGVPPERKYQRERGPGLADCFGLLDRVSAAPAPDRLQLLRWTVFNYLIGNADAHAKNLSLLLQPQGVRLAPYYDLVCTAVYPALSPKLAMKIGSKYDPEWVIGRYWQQFAQEAGLTWPLVRRTLSSMSRQLPEQAASLMDESGGGDAGIVEQIVQVIRQRAERTLRNLAAG